MGNALDIQIGGSHYKLQKMQPIELICKIRASFIQGCIIKYVTRYNDKNGVEDLNKVKHYAELAIQLCHSCVCKFDMMHRVAEYIKINNLTKKQELIIIAACLNSWVSVIDYAAELIDNFNNNNSEQID